MTSPPHAAAVGAGTLQLATELPQVHVRRRSAEAAVASWGTPPPLGETLDLGASADPELAAAVAAVSWYHTIELPGGVVTPGVFDHRPLVPYYGLPDDLGGRRALDVAPFDGFWSFELERRGADVVAVDIPRWSDLDHAHGVRDHMLRHGLDGPTGAGFALAANELRSRVRRVPCNVYDLEPGVAGTFDLVHVGDLLLHLRDPVRALERVRSVTAGSALIADCVNLSLPTSPGRHYTEYVGGWSDTIWWLPSVDTLAQMIVDAGFADVHLHQMYRLDMRRGQGPWRAVFVARP